jgi:hypothetical protein
LLLDSLIDNAFHLRSHIFHQALILHEQLESLSIIIRLGRCNLHIRPDCGPELVVAELSLLTRLNVDGSLQGLEGVVFLVHADRWGIGQVVEEDDVVLLWEPLHTDERLFIHLNADNLLVVSQQEHLPHINVSTLDILLGNDLQDVAIEADVLLCGVCDERDLLLELG